MPRPREKRAARAGRPGQRPPAAAPPAAVPPLAPTHPAFLVAGLVAAACIVLAVTFRLYDTDYWQHLLVGKVIWQQHRVPTTQLWTWPTHGAPDVNSSWGFEAMVYPLFAGWGVTGLFVWRWVTTLAAFGLLWATARRMGARGLAVLVALVLAAMIYRQRSQIRPETLVAVLISLELWILETRRRGGPDRSPWIVGLAWVWANVHISYFMGLVLLGLYGVPEAVERWRSGGSASGRSPVRLLWVGLAALAISFVNPFTWRALWQPFEYFLFWRHEPIFQVIGELGPVNWSLNRRNGLVLLGIGWPLLLLWRARRSGPDWVEVLACAGFSSMAIFAQRFLGFYALLAAPFAARDLDAWIAARRWPRWSQAPAARALVASAACVAILLPDWSLDDPPNGIGILTRNYPVAACDFMAAAGVSGRGYNQLRNAGYLLWRFWPEPGRLPFMDVHQAGTPEIRRLYVEALLSREGWRRLDDRFRFDWALLSRPPAPGDRTLDLLDADRAWALVFVDDAAALYVKRAGALAAVADRFAYRWLAAGRERLERLSDSCGTDTTLRRRVREELAREIAASPTTALAHSMLANLAMVERDFDRARAELDRALAVDPHTPLAHQRLGTIALATGKPYQALESFERERELAGDEAGLNLGIGMAYEQLGDLGNARSAYLRELRRHPGNPAVLEQLRRLETER